MTDVSYFPYIESKRVSISCKKCHKRYGHNDLLNQEQVRNKKINEVLKKIINKDIKLSLFMRYKPGDMVIKTTGGNKMSIYERISEGVYKCIWCVGNKLNESVFNEDEIIPIDEYRLVEERQYKINQILK